MKNYKVMLKSTGRITQLPDSQKIFGALITTLARMNGDEQATALVDAIFERKLHVALSNLLPLDYFPVPQDYIMDKLAGKRLENETLKERRAIIKKRNYVKSDILQQILKKPEMCTEKYSYVKASDSQQLRSSVESALYGIECLETKLYSVPILTLWEVKNEVEKAVSEFCFYLQMEESETLIRETIEALIQGKETLVLGKRASQGLNKYKIISVEEIDLPQSQHYLNLGMLLPNQIDFQKSTLRLFASERRPFVMPGGWNSKCEKYFISFIDSGSVIVLKNGIEQAGKCVRSPFYRNRDIVFGNAFLYPIILEKEEK